MKEYYLYVYQISLLTSYIRSTESACMKVTEALSERFTNAVLCEIYTNTVIRSKMMFRAFILQHSNYFKNLNFKKRI